MSLTKATYSMIEGAAANVVDFGADPTGATDSTAAIQAAINSGKAVYVPNGTYLVTALTLGAGTILRGETKERAILKGTAASSILTVSGFKKHVEVSNLTLDGDDVATHGVEVIELFYGVIEKLYIHNMATSGVFVRQNTYFNTFRDLTMEYCPTGLNINPTYNPAVVNGVVNENLFQQIQCRFFSARGAYIAGAIGNTFQNMDLEVSTDTATDCMTIDHGSNNKFIACWFEPSTNNAGMSQIVHLNDTTNPFWTQNNDFDTCVFTGGGTVGNKVPTGIYIENGYFNKIRNSIFARFDTQAINIAATSKNNIIEQGNNFQIDARPAIAGTSQPQVVKRSYGSFQFVTGTDTVDVSLDGVDSTFYYNDYRIDAIVTSFGSVSADQLNIYAFKNISPGKFRLYHSGANLAGVSTITVEYTVTYVIKP